MVVGETGRRVNGKILIGMWVVVTAAVVAVEAVVAVQFSSYELAVLFGIGDIVLGGVIYFIGWFVRPWRDGQAILAAALGQLHELSQEASDGHKNVTDLPRMREILSARLLKHPWDEFEDTLHKQEDSVANEFGQRGIARYRQTIPAEMYFSQTALIEVPLRTEFFKHLPGMLTGLGIIGTFSGLIFGLKDFGVDPTVNSNNSGIDSLIESVSYAFIVSLLAIVAAIGITIFEKFMISRRVQQVAELCDALDRLFDAGAGEEYLSRLVIASEEGAAQTTQLKDALVAEITEVLERMTQMQVEALREGAAQQSEATRAAASIIADEMAKQIKDTFEAPLKMVANSIAATNQSTQERVGTVLHDLLAQFSNQVESMFGNQMEELASLLQETSTMMQTTVSRLDGLADGLESAGQRTVAGMGEAMQAQLSGIALELGGQIAQIVSEVQSATGELQANLLSGQQQLNEATQTTISDLTGQIAAAHEGTNAATEAMRESVTSLAESTQEALESFEASTRRLESATSLIQSAGKELASNLQAANGVVSQLLEATTVSADALTATREMVRGLEAGAAEITEALGTVREVLENAQRDTAATSELVSAVKTAAAALTKAQGGTENFLDGLEEALIKAHDDFSRQVDNSLDATTKVFHQDLEKATKQLSGVVKELGDVLEEALDRRDGDS